MSSYTSKISDLSDIISKSREEIAKKLDLSDEKAINLVYNAINRASEKELTKMKNMETTQVESPTTNFKFLGETIQIPIELKNQTFLLYASMIEGYELYSGDGLKWMDKLADNGLVIGDKLVEKKMREMLQKNQKEGVQ